MDRLRCRPRRSRLVLGRVRRNAESVARRRSPRRYAVVGPDGEPVRHADAGADARAGAVFRCLRETTNPKLSSRRSSPVPTRYTPTSSPNDSPTYSSLPTYAIGRAEKRVVRGLGFRSVFVLNLLSTHRSRRRARTTARRIRRSPRLPRVEIHPPDDPRAQPRRRLDPL